MDIEIRTGLLRTGSGRTFVSDKQTFERFMSKVVSVGDCWEFQGAKTRGGYGHFGVHTPRGMEMLRCHIYVCTVVNRKIGKVVRHSCDNPVCCNPAHLSVGTVQDNSDDMTCRGRSAKGRATITAKHKAGPTTTMTEELYKEVFRMKSQGMKQIDIASTLGMTAATVSRVLNGKTWGWLK